MKKREVINTIVILICIFLTLPVNATTVEIERSNIDVCDITEEERKTIAYGLGLKVFSSKTIRNVDGFVIGFDVSDNGELAIAFDDCSILVMTADYEVYNIMSAAGYGEYFALDWNGEYIDVVSRGRQSYIVSITPEGEVVDAVKYDYTEKTYDYLHELDFNRSSIEYNGCTYVMKNSSKLTDGIGGGKADTLVCIDENGNEKIIYQSKEPVPNNAKYGLVVILVVFVFGPMFFLFVVLRR